MPSYRSNVAAIIMNKKGQVLLCERANNRRSWQFPQGGVDKGETKRQALYREVFEEVGLHKAYFEILQKKGGFKYLYPPNVSTKKKYDGQKQTYYLCRLKKKAPKIDLGKNNPEFRDYDWVLPEDIEESWLPDFKIDVYKAVLDHFFGVTINAS